MIHLIKDIIFGWRFKRAVRQAMEAQRLTGRKQFIIVYDGKPLVISKKKIRELVATRFFRKGTTVQDIERKALFVTK